MLDDQAYKDRAPFDVSAIDEGIQTLVSDRVAAVQRPPLRRLATGGDRPAIGSAAPNNSAVEESAGATDTTPAERDPLLVSRQNTHGSFADNARVSQAIKRVLREQPGWELLTDVERESMDMIALKFSRIVSGKSLELQHWEDVVGYGKLAEEQCKVVS